MTASFLFVQNALSLDLVGHMAGLVKKIAYSLCEEEGWKMFRRLAAGFGCRIRVTSDTFNLALEAMV